MAWIGAIVQGVMGGIQLGVAKTELDALPDPQGFSTSSDLATATSMARRAAQQGMSPAERAAAEQAIGTAQSRMQRSMEQRGLGNLAAAVSQIRTTEAMNALAAQNAQIKRQSLGQYAQLAGQMQQLQDQNTRSFNQMLYAQQQALGQAAQSGFQNLAGMGGSIAMAIEGADAAKQEAVGDGAVTQQSLMGSQATTPTTPTTTTAASPFNRVADPAMESYSPEQAAIMQDQGLGVATDPGAYGGMPGVMQPNVNQAVPTSNFAPSSNVSSQIPAFGGGQIQTLPNYQMPVFTDPSFYAPGSMDDFGTITG